ncbi:hypothetical protein [Acinetobacter equi]|uniref:DUF3298 domain-containing protein n=1 Tax=Acinetobacter equi TaxID=1324350 RepID=A0A0N7GXD9_9GAMM|nr:hypothetical protein [Acinetobacter equi]ALH94443.1 hypothetical protein AOY20_02195 [Acinetobacter equi]
MKNIFFILIIFFNCLSVSLASPIHFNPKTILSKDKLLTGNIPYIKNKEFKLLNKQIHSELFKDYDETRIEFFSEILYQDEDYLTLKVHKEIQGGRSYSREQYFVIDLKQKKILNLFEILDHYDISASEIENQISKQLKTINETELSNESFENFQLTELAYFYNEHPEIIILNDKTSFYLNNNILGISFDIGVASYAFEFKVAHESLKAIL